MNLYELLILARRKEIFESEEKINWILSNQKLYSKLIDRIKNDITTGDLTPQRVLEYFDNSSKAIGKFLPWVVKMYINKEFDMAHLDTIRGSLDIFYYNLPKFSNKDINSYRTLNDLNIAIDNIKGVKTSGDKKRDAKKSSKKIFENNKWIIIIPETKEAAIKYGKGTTWCTSAKKDNAFDAYNVDGPLIIIINKQNPSEKYQLHYPTNSYRDSEDDDMELVDFFIKNPEIKDFLLNYTDALPPINDDYRWRDLNSLNYNDWVNLLNTEPFAIKYAPKKWKEKLTKEESLEIYYS